MDGFSVQFTGLADAAADLAAINRDIDNSLQTLRGEVASRSASWDGAARDAWSSVDATLTAKQNEMTVLVASMSTFADNANAQMMSTEQRNTSLFGA